MSIAEAENRRFQSFDSTYTAKVFYKKPDKYREIEQLSKFDGNLINLGSNLSYSPLSFYADSLSIDLKKFNRIINFDKQNKEITIEAGMTLAQLLNFTLKYNLWIPQLPGYPFITIGGAAATNAHGKSCANHGTIKNSIKNILIFHNKNGWLNLSKNENKEIFDLTIGGIGLTGTIMNITLKLEEFKNKMFTTSAKKVSSIKECIDTIKLKSTKNNSFIYSWNMAGSLKDLGKGFVFENTVSKVDTYINKKIPEKMPTSLYKPSFSMWNKLSIKFANEVFNFINSLKKNEKKEDFTKVIFPFYGKESYFNLFGKEGFIESQLLISEDDIYDFFDEFKYLFKLHNPAISLLSFKNMRGDQELLRFEDNKICVTLDYINNKRNLKFLKDIDKICLKYNITPSIIKDSRLSKTTVEECYPELEKFKKKLNAFDNKRIYKSATSERLGI